MNKKTANRHSWIHILLLLGWITSAIALRFNHLSLKPASSIEIATLGFSLGNGFAQIPIDRLVSVSTLLAPLRFDPTVSVGEITNILFRESTHPPLYFWLTHWWTKLFVSPEELVSLEIGRSLSAILGAMAVPGMFGLGWLAFRSRWQFRPTVFIFPKKLVTILSAFCGLLPRCLVVSLPPAVLKSVLGSPYWWR